MTPSARTQAICDILDLIAKELRPADSLIQAYFKTRRYIGSKDRNAIAEKAYDLIRHHGRIGWWLDFLEQQDTPRTRLIVYLRLVEKMTPAEIEGMWDGKKFAPASLDPTEKKLLRLLTGRTYDHPEMQESAKFECPPWAEESLRKRFGKAFKDEMKAMLSQAPLDMRANTLKTTRDEALAHLKSLGLKAEATRYAPLGLRLRQRVALGNIPFLKKGAIEIQDEGSQLVALLVDAKPGERIVDFCAGAGGKTLAIGAQMANKGRVIACDVLENRLKRSMDRFARAGMHNVEIHPLTSEKDPWVKRHKMSFDRVLVDAPCSGTGTWRRNPDQRWRSLGPGLDSLLPLQASILTSAARLVREGGRLVYATCSMLAEENEDQVQRFLQENTDFKLLPLAEAFPDFEWPDKRDPYLRLTPARHDTDGFFGAILVRSAKQTEAKD